MKPLLSRLLLGAISLYCASNVVQAAEPDPYFEENRAFLRMRKSTDGFQLMRNLAERGVANGQYEVANALYKGLGVTRNVPEAAKWAEKAAEQNHLHALLLIGVINRYGEAGRKDVPAALKWYRRAAELRIDLGSA